MIRLTDVIVFDLNGLLVGDELIQLQATNEVLSAYGIALSEKTWIEECVGHKLNEYLPRMLAHMTRVNIAQIVREKDVIYFMRVSENVHNIMRHGALSFLEYARQSKKLLALATSTTKPGAVAIIDDKTLKINQYFELVITGDDVTKAKPDPEIYNEIRRRLGVNLRYTALEDSSPGVNSAKAAGGMHRRSKQVYGLTEFFSGGCRNHEFSA